MFGPIVTEAARGIGFALLSAYASDPNNIVFAGVRDPSSATAVKELARTARGDVRLVKITSADEGDNKQAAKVLADYGTAVGVGARLDVLIANAGRS